MSTTVEDLLFELTDCQDQIVWAGNSRVAAGGPEFLALLAAVPGTFEVVDGLEVHLADGSWLECDYDAMDETSIWVWRRARSRGSQPMSVVALPRSQSIDSANPPEPRAAEDAENAERWTLEAADQARVGALMELVKAECAFCAAPTSNDLHRSNGFFLAHNNNEDRICGRCAQALLSREESGLDDLSRAGELPLPVEPPIPIELQPPPKTVIVGQQRVAAKPVALHELVPRDALPPGGVAGAVRVVR